MTNKRKVRIYAPVLIPDIVAASHIRYRYRQQDKWWVDPYIDR